MDTKTETKPRRRDLLNAEHVRWIRFQALSDEAKAITLLPEEREYLLHDRERYLDWMSGRTLEERQGCEHPAVRDGLILHFAYRRAAQIVCLGVTPDCDPAADDHTEGYDYEQ